MQPGKLTWSCSELLLLHSAAAKKEKNAGVSLKANCGEAAFLLRRLICCEGSSDLQAARNICVKQAASPVRCRFYSNWSASRTSSCSACLNETAHSHTFKTRFSCEIPRFMSRFIPRSVCVRMSGTLSQDHRWMCVCAVPAVPSVSAAPPSQGSASGPTTLLCCVFVRPSVSRISLTSLQQRRTAAGSAESVLAV